MKKFSIFHIPALSFYSKELYKDVGLNWKGANLGYLLLLLVICWIPGIVKMQMGLSDFINNDAPQFVEQIPDINIIDGRVSVNQPQPYYIFVPESNEPLAVIDTTGQINSIEDANALALLTETRFTFRKSKLETSTFGLSEIKSMTINKAKIYKWLNIFKKFFTVLFMPFIIFGSFLWRIVEAMILAAIGLFFASRYKVKLPYSATVRLAITAMTPCIIIKTVIGAISNPIPAQILFFLIITVGFLYFGVKSCSEVKPEKLF